LVWIQFGFQEPPEKKSNGFRSDDLPSNGPQMAPHANNSALKITFQIYLMLWSVTRHGTPFSDPNKFHNMLKNSNKNQIMNVSIKLKWQTLNCQYFYFIFVLQGIRMRRSKREKQKTDVWPDKKIFNPEFRKN